MRLAVGAFCMKSLHRSRYVKFYFYSEKVFEVYLINNFGMLYPKGVKEGVAKYVK